MILFLALLGFIAIAVIVIPGELIRRDKPKSWLEVELDRFQRENA